MEEIKGLGADLIQVSKDGNKYLKIRIRDKYVILSRKGVKELKSFLEEYLEDLRIKEIVEGVSK